MTVQKLNDIFENSDNIKYSEDLNESASDGTKVDGVNILGRVYGPFFKPDGESANKRFYSKGLWENALNKSQSLISEGRMVGTIGHEQPLSDKDLLEGKGAHRITKLWVDPQTNIGMGEAVILNTTAGRELNAYLRGGVKLAVSSRAFGEYSGKTESGANIVNPDTYDLECFDFVRTPGISIAFPNLVENHDSGATKVENTELPPNKGTTDTVLPNSSIVIEKDKSKSTENTMSNELVESLTLDKVNLQKTVTETLDKVQILEQKLDTANTANETLKTSLAAKNEENGSLTKKLEESEGKVTAVTAELDEYKEIGSADSIKESLALSTTLIEELETIGTLEQIGKVMDVAEEYTELGSPDEVSSALDMLDAYIEVGSVEDIAAAVEVASNCESLGGVEGITKKLELLKTYEELGTPEEISKVFELTQSKIQESRNETKKAEVVAISNTFGVESALVEELLETTDVAGVKKMLEKLQSNNITRRYMKPSGESTTIVEGSDTPAAPGTRLGRMLENHSR